MALSTKALLHVRLKNCLSLVILIGFRSYQKNNPYTDYYSFSMSMMITCFFQEDE